MTINKDYYVKKMQAILDENGYGDHERLHIDADDLLCQVLMELGYKELVDLYNEIYKWYA